MTAESRPANAEHLDLFTWAEGQERERQQAEKRIAEANRERAEARGFVVIATNPEVEPDSPGYREVYATEARTPAQAVAKVRPLVSAGRRLRAFLATGQFSAELPTATWVR